MIRYKRGNEYLMETGDGRGVIYNSALKRLTGEAPIDAWLSKGGWSEFEGDPGPVMAEAADAKIETKKTLDPYTADRLKKGTWRDLIIAGPGDTVQDVIARDSSSSSSA